MLSSIDNKPPAAIAPAPQPPAGGNFQQDFNAFAGPAVRAWVDLETATLLRGPLDLKRLERDAASRGAAASDPATAALVLRLAVEYRLLAAYDQRRTNATPSGPSPAATGGPSQAQLMNATQGMQETQMSFNMQYLQLQNSMQNDNRQFTVVESIMQAKHDTAKSTISSIH